LLIDLVAGRELRAVPAAEAERRPDEALEHRVEGLLWDAVRRGSVPLPPTFVQRLARHDLRTQAGNGRLWKALQDVDRILGDIGVSVVAAKGVAAEARWYDRLGQRPCNDVDVVLDPAAVPRIRDVVAALEPSHFMLDDLPALVGSGILQSVDVTFAGVEIDIHADLLKVEVPTRQADVLWSRSTDVAGPGDMRIRAIDAEMSLIHFLIHLNKDRFARLLGYTDVIRILRSADLDWDFIDRFLAREGLRTPAYAALDAVARDLGVPALTHRHVGAVTGAVWQILWRPPLRLRGLSGTVSQAHRQLWIPWLAPGRFAEAVRWWLRRRVFPPTALLPVYHPDTSGSYLRRLAVGRIRRIKERRRIQRGLAVDPQIALLAGERFKTFPPKWSHIQVPTSSSQAALAALALYSPCQPAGYAVRDTAWHAVRTMGPRALPSRRRRWDPPMDADTWRTLLDRLRQELGRFDSLAVLARPQPERSGFSLLLIDGDRGRAFVRIHRGAVVQFRAQAAALDACTAAAVASFWHPSVLGSGAVGKWSYLATTALAPQRHVAVRDRPDAVLAEMQSAMQGLPRAADVPIHWQPLHGDFTHWNCRRLPDRRVAVFDWEDAGWGPPGADDVLFRATAAALSGAVPAAGPDEAVAFWARRLTERVRLRAGEQLSQETLRALQQMVVEPATLTRQTS
jgi:hypothetical protein